QPDTRQDSVGAVTPADFIQQLPLLRREAAHALRADLLEHAIELVEQLLLLARPASPRDRWRSSGGGARLVLGHHLQLAPIHHLAQSAESSAGRSEPQIDEAGSEAAE